MPITPDAPFPKSAGDAIKSKDWNDLVTETQRLDTAKVNRAGDVITGPLTIAGALAVGKPAAAAGTMLDLAGGDLRINDRNLMLRGGTDPNHGLGWYGGTKTWAGLNIDGPVLYGNAGGALGVNAGGTPSTALRWDGAGNITIGNTSGAAPSALKVDIGDRIRLRQGAAGDAGHWLYQTTPAEDRAFIGMAGDNTVGFWGNKGIGWGLQMNVANGTTGVRMAPNTGIGLSVNPGAVGSVPATVHGLYVAPGATWYGLYVAGRAADQSIRTTVASANQIATTVTTSWVDMPDMSLTVLVPPNISRWFQIMVIINGVQATGSTTIGGYFRLLVDGGQWDMTRHEFHNNGWELRGVTLGRMAQLGPGTHTISVQWFTTAGTLRCCWYGDLRQIMVVEL